METIFGFLFVATIFGILMRFIITAVLGAITRAAAEGSPPVAVIAAAGTVLGAIAAFGSFIVALVKLFDF